MDPFGVLPGDLVLDRSGYQEVAVQLEQLDVRYRVGAGEAGDGVGLVDSEQRNPVGPVGYVMPVLVLVRPGGGVAAGFGRSLAGWTKWLWSFRSRFRIIAGMMWR